LFAAVTGDELKDLYHGFIKQNPSGKMDFENWLHSPANPVAGDECTPFLSDLGLGWKYLYETELT
tara:strand:- start:1392 stop:1586 length:195 start_codon:yes stop_codon:yes gene_type:complete